MAAAEAGRRHRRGRVQGHRSREVGVQSLDAQQQTDRPRDEEERRATAAAAAAAAAAEQQQ